MKIKHSIIIFTLFFFNNLITHGQSKDYETFYNIFFIGNYKKAATELIYLKNKYPDNIKTNIAFADFFYVMYKTSGGMEVYNSLCKKEAKIVESKLLRKKVLSSNDIYYLISAKSLLLKIEFDKKHYLKAAKGFKQLIKYFKYALKHQDNPKLKLVAGMYYYYVEAAKVDYPMTKPVLLFFPKGNKLKGLKLLYECYKSKNTYIKISSELFLANIYRNSEHNFKKSQFFYNLLLKKYPKNLHWRKYYIDFLKEYNKTKEAKKQKDILMQVLNSNKFYTKHQIIYFKNA